MRPEEKAHYSPLRNEIARRIRELRANRRIWAPAAPRADMRCRRNIELTELTALTSPCSLGDLVFSAKSCGRTDLDNLLVRLEAQPVPYEDHTVDVVVLSFYQKVADEKYAHQIGGLWEEYQRARHAAAGRSEEYERFLQLKQIFEPS
jgi:hypothetical protein